MSGSPVGQVSDDCDFDDNTCLGILHVGLVTQPRPVKSGIHQHSLKAIHETPKKLVFLQRTSKEGMSFSITRDHKVMLMQSDQIHMSIDLNSKSSKEVIRMSNIVCVDKVFKAPSETFISSP